MDQKTKKSWINGIPYYNDMRTNCKVDLGDGNIIDLPHTRDDIAGLQNSVDVAVDSKVPLNGTDIPVALAESLIRKGKEVNVELYRHLWDKYSEVDSCTTEEEINAVVWEYDIEQIYTLG